MNQNNLEKEELSKKVLEEFSNIERNEPDMAKAISMLIKHINGTYSDKYARGISKGVDTKAMLYDKEGGKFVNTYQIARYLQRYITSGKPKSYLAIDLFKMCHYAMFEVVRRIKCGEIDIHEPKS